MKWSLDMEIFSEQVIMPLSESLEFYYRCKYVPLEHCDVADAKQLYVEQVIGDHATFTGTAITAQKSIVLIKNGRPYAIFIKALLANCINLHVNNQLLTLVDEGKRNALGYFNRF